MYVDHADFAYLLEQTEATKGNLSAQITKLRDAGYINVKKSFKGNYPLTTCRISSKGKKAFEGYVEAIKGYIG